MKQENKTKSVKKFSVKMLLAMVFGGVLENKTEMSGNPNERG